MEVLAYAVPLVLFLTLFALLHRRAAGQGRPVGLPWAWLAAILLCAGVALVLGAVV